MSNITTLEFNGDYDKLETNHSNIVDRMIKDNLIYEAIQKRISMIKCSYWQAEKYINERQQTLQLETEIMEYLKKKRFKVPTSDFNF